MYIYSVFLIWPAINHQIESIFRYIPLYLGLNLWANWRLLMLPPIWAIINYSVFFIFTECFSYAASGSVSLCIYALHIVSHPLDTHASRRQCIYIPLFMYTDTYVCVCVCERVQFARTSVSCNLIPRTKRYHLSHNRRTQIQIKIQIQVQIRIQIRSSKYKIQ